MRRIAVLLVAAACSSKPPPPTVRVAAASSLVHAFHELAPEFERQTGIAAVVQFDASGVLAEQIERGEPFFLFAAANKDFVDRVVAAGRCDGATVQPYAQGRLAVWSRGAGPAKLADLADPRFRRIAIASDVQAPFGKAAREALLAAGIADAVAGKLVVTTNAELAMQEARDGRADAALVPLSLAVVTDGGGFLRIDPALHTPFEQTLVVCGNGEEADRARRLAQFIASADGREMMARYGFSLPRTPP